MNSALLYVRVSSKDQEREGYSLDAQEKLGHEYALRKGLTIIKSWKVSESAWKKDRTAFNQMVDYAKKHTEVKHIIFDITDRMTRNDFDKLKIYTLLQEHDKTIHFSRTNKTIDKNSGSDDVFMFDIEVAVAKKMSNDISRKTRMGMLEKAQQGLFPGYAPLGYLNNKITHLMDIDEVKSTFIKKAFDLIASGSHSLGMLADTLYREGFRGKANNRVGKSALDHILRNPVYYGAFWWNGEIYQGSHIPIVSKELFDKVRSILDGNHRPSCRVKNFAFNNLMTCGICDCKILGERKKKKYNYYHCTFSKGRHNGIPYLPEDKLSEMFRDTIQKVTLPENVSNWLKEALKETNKNTIELQERRLNSLKNEHEKVNNRLSRLYDAKFDGSVEEEVYKAKETEYKKQLIEIKSQMDGMKAINPNFYEDGCKTLELSKRLSFLYERATYEEKAKMLRLVASNYVLTPQNIISSYKKPFSFFAEGSSRTMMLPR